MGNVIGQKLKRLRETKGITQRELGALCGMPDSQIRKYESGTITPKYETLQRIADALDVSILDLLCDSGAQTAFNVAAKAINQKTAFVEDIIKNAERPSNIEIELEDLPLLEFYHELNDDGKEKVIDYAADLTENPKYSARRTDPPGDS